MLKNIIGIVGTRLSGKDTVANAIQNIFPDFHKINIANKIKENYANLLNINPDILFKQGIEKEEHRMGLITLGLLRREENPDYWVEQVNNIAVQLNYTNIVIPDIRYENEYNYFCSVAQEVYLIEVNVEDYIKRQRGWKENFAADNTKSEIEFKKLKKFIDFKINNNTTKKHILYQLALFTKIFEL